MSNYIDVKPIYELLNKEFLIPHYQRGYRWGEKEIENLLDDIWEFTKKKKNEGEFYSLQPVVLIKRNDNKWEVIDGQQRLTAIYLIIKYLFENVYKREISEYYPGKSLYEITYEVRPGSKEFLKTLDEKQKDKYVDFYKMFHAFQTIKKWFDEKKFNINDYDDFRKTLLGNTNAHFPVKIIWYEIMEDVDPVDIFTRLNIGKIPLTNAELIKALFLSHVKQKTSSVNPTSEQLRIATEWDLIENELHQEAFWYFLRNNYKDEYDTRIEFIFDLIKDKKPDNDDYYTFYEFYNELKDKDFSYFENKWRQIKHYYQIFKEWYENKTLYHLIGFLIATGNDIKDIMKAYKKKNKEEFVEYLKKDLIKNQVFDNLEELNYSDNKEDITKVLLLFNLIILLQNEAAYIKFPFDKYKNEAWDIEHISSKANPELTGKDLKEYVKLILEFFSGENIDAISVDDNFCEAIPNDSLNKEVCQLLVNIYNDPVKNENLFQDVLSQLQQQFRVNEWDDELTDKISNLVLLNRNINRAYKNAFFPIKRSYIIGKIKAGTFVPVATQNVFLKTYSKKFDNIMYWTNDDAKAYLEAMKQTFNEFFQ